MTAKPTVAELGIDPAAQAWRGSGHGDGRVEVAFARAAPVAPVPPVAPATPAARGPGSAARGPDLAAPVPVPVPEPEPEPEPEPDDRAEWVLMRVTGDPEHRVLVFDRHEWECFLDGARNGEFDDAAAAAPAPVPVRNTPVS